MVTSRPLRRVRFTFVAGYSVEDMLRDLDRLSEVRVVGVSERTRVDVDLAATVSAAETDQEM
jgi:hypothetical protein